MPKKREKNTSRSRMKSLLKEYYLSAQLDRGYELYSIETPNEKVYYPLGHLRRRTDQSFQSQEIQFSDHGGPAFLVNFGNIPLEGVFTQKGHNTPAEKCYAAWAPDAHRLHPYRIGKFWFGLWPWQDGEDDRRLESVAIKATKLSVEIEQFFLEGRIGPHVKRSIWIPPPI